MSAALAGVRRKSNCPPLTGPTDVISPDTDRKNIKETTNSLCESNRMNGIEMTGALTIILIV
jgi:hypothetical protein